ncbi:hypothetical protein AM233_04580 [Bacillus sp. FJAT-22058]|nr:hypothetical protein AM233_04580 [Bacillus sp. FJAT-22058]
MQLQSLYIKNYKIIENCKVIFVPKGGYPNYYYDYFDNNSFTVLIGENGNGKTTLMSFLVNIFHNLQRYHYRIPSNFTLNYKIHINSEEKVVLLEKEEGNIFVTVENHLPRSLLLEYHLQRGYVVKTYQKQFKNLVTYEDIRKFLPANVITSVFSMHGEYPSKRPPKFIGDQIVHQYNISDIYGFNHFNFSSLSKGIRRFLEIYYQDSSALDDFLDLLNLKFCKQVYVRLRNTPPWNLLVNYDDFYNRRKEDVELERLINNYFDREEDTWISLDNSNYKEIIQSEQREWFYLNDLLFEKNGDQLFLGNMSSGEKMFFIRVLSLLSSIEDNSLIVIEEPELHLNPAWTKQIITMLQMLFSKYKVHFVISTHSHSFINTVFPENLIFAQNKKFLNPDPMINTFLGNEAEINNRFFTNSKTNNYIEQRLWEKIGHHNVTELETILEYLGESYIKFKIFNILMREKGIDEDVES